MKTITIYELLGLVKDGKAPKKIKYEDDIYELTSNENDYYNKSYGYWFTNQICSLGALNDEVEILEEEKKIPEKLDHITIYGETISSLRNELQKTTTRFENKINEIIDCLEHFKNKGDE